MSEESRAMADEAWCDEGLRAEGEGLASNAGVDPLNVVVGTDAIDPSLLYFPLECGTLEGGPSAFAQDIGGLYLPCLRAEENEVGLVAGTDKSAIVYVEEECRIVAHQFHDTLHGAQSFL